MYPPKAAPKGEAMSVEGAAKNVKNAEDWLVNFVNEQRIKRGDSVGTWEGIQEDAMLYGYSIPELMARYVSDVTEKAQ